MTIGQNKYERALNTLATEPTMRQMRLCEDESTMDRKLQAFRENTAWKIEEMIKILEFLAVRDRTEIAKVVKLRNAWIDFRDSQTEGGLINIIHEVMEMAL